MVTDKYNPFEWVASGRREKGRNPLQDAIAILWKSVNVADVRTILQPRNPAMAVDGLYVLSEAGPLPSDALDLLLLHISDADWQSRFYAANCLLVSYRNLSGTQLSTALKLSSDEDASVRCKMMEILAIIGIARLSEAIALMPQHEEKSEHVAGLELLQQPRDNKDLLALIAVSGPVRTCYAGAKLLQNARSGITDFSLGLGPGAKEELDYLRWRIAQIAQ
jgi:hypothetical protein